MSKKIPIDLFLTEHLPWADKGHIPSILAVAKYYLDRAETEADIHQAISWYEVAVRHGSEEAMLLLGQIYELGWGVPVDCDKAIELYTRAEAAGGFKGAYLLGLLYDFGFCERKDARKALHHYQVAAKRGHLVSAIRVSKFMRSGYLGRARRITGWAFGLLALTKMLLYILTGRRGDRIWGAGRLVRDTPSIRKLKRGTRFESDGLLH